MTNVSSTSGRAVRGWNCAVPMRHVPTSTGNGGNPAAGAKAVERRAAGGN